MNTPIANEAGNAPAGPAAVIEDANDTVLDPEVVPDPSELPAKPASLTERTMAELVAHRDQYGTVPNRLVVKAGHCLGKSPRTIRRWLAGSATDADGTDVRHFALDDVHLEAVAAHNGNVAKAHQDLKRGGHKVPSYTTLWRAWRQQPEGLQAFISNGADAMKAKWLYAPYTAPSRNSVWQADHFELPVDVIPDNCETTTCKPWITLFEDDKTRMIMAFEMVAIPGRRPDAATVSACIAAAIAPHTVGGVEIGGIPGAIRWDQAKEFAAGMVTQLALRVGFDAHAVPPFSGHMKGKIERAGKTVQAEVASLCTGYTHGAKTLRSKMPFRDEPITERLLRARLAEWVEYYNTQRPHGSLGGRTPLEVWVEDQTPVRWAEQDLLRDSFLVEPRPRKVSKKGVFFRNQWWLGVDLLDHVSRRVEVRYPVGDDTFIEVYLNGEWICTATPAESLTTAERHALSKARNAQYKTARAIQDAGRQRRAQANAATSADDPGLPPFSLMEIDDGLAPDATDLWDLLAEQEDTP